MIDGLEPYADRRDSGLPWLGKIPAHWEVRRNGRLFVQRNETGFPDLPILEVSLKTGVRVRDFEGTNRKQVMSDREKYKRARQGDIAYNMMRLWQGAVGTSPVDGLVSPAYIVAKPLPQTDSRYYQYLFRTGAYMDEVNKFSRGIVSDRNRLYWEDFKQMPSPFPPPEEQAAIVRFLDHADRRIRRYIRAKRQLIALLNEQKQAIIHRAVTRGLDPHVKLKPSGVEWLGDVPEHWEVTRLGRLSELLTGFAFKSDGFIHDAEGIRLLRGVNVTPGTIRWEDVVRWPAHDKNAYKDYLLEPGDIVLGMDRPIISGGMRVACIADIDTPSLLLQRVARLRPKQTLHHGYLLLLLQGRGFADYLEPIFTGVSVPHISPQQICDYRCAAPPISEQHDIVRKVEDESAAANQTIQKCLNEIDLLREFRARLIADAITGKLDVRETAVALSDELEAVEPNAEELLDEDETTDDAELDTEPKEIEA